MLSKSIRFSTRNGHWMQKYGKNLNSTILELIIILVVAYKYIVY